MYSICALAQSVTGHKVCSQAQKALTCLGACITMYLNTLVSTLEKPRLSGVFSIFRYPACRPTGLTAKSARRGHISTEPSGRVSRLSFVLPPLPEKRSYPHVRVVSISACQPQGFYRTRESKY